jgi:hypothetical protein
VVFRVPLIRNHCVLLPGVPEADHHVILVEALPDAPPDPLLDLRHLRVAVMHHGTNLLVSISPACRVDLSRALPRLALLARDVEIDDLPLRQVDEAAETLRSLPRWFNETSNVSTEAMVTVRAAIAQDCTAHRRTGAISGGRAA